MSWNYLADFCTRQEKKKQTLATGLSADKIPFQAELKQKFVCYFFNNFVNLDYASHKTKG